eukprot:7559027-Lingulodinium_polyedra.AAC.1
MVPANSALNVGLKLIECNVMITFDGGSRSVLGHQVAAGAAVLWARSHPSELWARKMTITRAV